MKAIGQLIHNRRKDLLLTQKDLAATVGITQGNLSRIEQGKQEITIGMLRKFETVLNISLGRHTNEVETTDIFGMETLYELSSLYNRSEYTQMLQLIQRAESAEFFTNPQNECRLLYWKARALDSLQRFDEANAVYQRILESGQVRTDARFIATVHTSMGDLYQDVGNFELAVQCFNEALQIAREAPSLQFDREFMYTLLYGLGTTHTYVGNYDQAGTYLSKASNYTEDRMVQAIRDHASTIYTRGALMALKEKHVEAIELYTEALQYYRKLNITDALMNVSQNIAFSLKMLGRTEESEAMFQDVLVLARKYPMHVTPVLISEMRNEGYEI